jgi:hypothetical protein
MSDRKKIVYNRNKKRERELFLSRIAPSKETIAPAERRLKGWILPVYTNRLGASFSYLVLVK